MKNGKWRIKNEEKCSMKEEAVGAPGLQVSAGCTTKECRFAIFGFRIDGI
jgi:hypothetical protein